MCVCMCVCVCVYVYTFLPVCFWYTVGHLCTFDCVSVSNEYVGTCVCSGVDIWMCYNIVEILHVCV